jgi:histidine ammonia-lyase
MPSHSDSRSIPAQTFQRRHDPVTLSGVTLTPEAVRAVARDGAPVTLEPVALSRLAADREVVETAVRDQTPAYGVTTGLGPRATRALAREELAEFSVRTVRGRANSVGEPLPRPIVRAVMLARLNSLAHGGSGVQVAVAALLRDMLNAGVHPMVPRSGSVGASDLCQLAHIGEVVMGEGTAEYEGEYLPGAQALGKAGLRPVALGPKDGLVLCSANSVSAGAGALAYADARSALLTAQAVAALSFEGFRANTTPLDPRVQAARPAPGQQAAAEHLLALLDGGLLGDPANARRIQDPISLRCVSQVHGSLLAALDFVQPALGAELNGAADNPLVLAADGLILSTGNFHTPVLALSFDTLALALCQVAALSASRVQCLLNTRLTGLPPTLSPRGAGRSGFAPIEKTAQALVTEIRHLSTPVCTAAQTSADGVEDDSTNAPLAARRTGAIVDRLRLVLAVEALVAAQAVDLAAPGRLGAAPALLHRAVRAVAEPLDDDRSSGPDVTRIAESVLGDPELLDGIRALAELR